jgi:hypothetical protein
MAGDDAFWLAMDPARGRPRRESWFSLEPYRPAMGFSNSHAQTVASTVLRSQRNVFFYRERIDTPDGDFLDLDIAGVIGRPLPDNAPLILLLHGLEGNARRHYALEIYRQLAAWGIRSVGMNFRSCSGEMNRTATLYHAGATEDVATAHDWLDRRFPAAPKGMVGVSLGANMLLKYLGERGADLSIRLRGAAAISPPFDLALGAARPSTRPLSFYADRFVQSIQVKIKAKIEQNATIFAPRVDVHAALAAQTLQQLDDAFTAPLHGFQDAQDYYARCSSRRYLAGIRVPTLVLRAKDDPLIPVEDIPFDLLDANPALFPGITEQGGHVGWIEGLPGRYRFWAERQTARFLAALLIAS